MAAAAKNDKASKQFQNGGTHKIASPSKKSLILATTIHTESQNVKYIFSLSELSNCPKLKSEKKKKSLEHSSITSQILCHGKSQIYQRGGSRNFCWLFGWLVK